MMDLKVLKKNNKQSNKQTKTLSSCFRTLVTKEKTRNVFSDKGPVRLLIKQIGQAKQ